MKVYSDRSMYNETLNDLSWVLGRKNERRAEVAEGGLRSKIFFRL